MKVPASSPPDRSLLPGSGQEWWLPPRSSSEPFAWVAVDLVNDRSDILQVDRPRFGGDAIIVRMACEEMPEGHLEVAITPILYGGGGFQISDMGTIQSSFPEEIVLEDIPDDALISALDVLGVQAYGTQPNGEYQAVVRYEQVGPTLDKFAALAREVSRVVYDRGQSPAFG